MIYFQSISEIFAICVLFQLGFATSWNEPDFVTLNILMKHPGEIDLHHPEIIKMAIYHLPC
jgi:hypothetical protein